MLAHWDSVSTGTTNLKDDFDQWRTQELLGVREAWACWELILNEAMVNTQCAASIIQAMYALIRTTSDQSAYVEMVAELQEADELTEKSQEELQEELRLFEVDGFDSARRLLGLYKRLHNIVDYTRKWGHAFYRTWQNAMAYIEDRTDRSKDEQDRCISGAIFRWSPYFVRDGQVWAILDSSKLVSTSTTNVMVNSEVKLKVTENGANRYINGIVSRCDSQDDGTTCLTISTRRGEIAPEVAGGSIYQLVRDPKLNRILTATATLFGAAAPASATQFARILLSDHSQEVGDHNYCDDGWASHIQPIWDQSVLDAEGPLCNRMLSASQQSAFEDSRGKRLALIQGPPGTGKTTLIAHMIGQPRIIKVKGPIIGSLRRSGVGHRAHYAAGHCNGSLQCLMPSLPSGGSQTA